MKPRKYLTHAIEIKKWMEDRKTTQPPSRRSKDLEERRLGNLLKNIRHDLIKPYMELTTEEEREKYRKKHPQLEEIMEIIRDIDKNKSVYLKKAREAKKWMEDRQTSKPPSHCSKDLEERRLNASLRDMKHDIIKPYMELTTEEEKEKYRDKHPELDEMMEIMEWIKSRKLQAKLAGLSTSQKNTEERKRIRPVSKSPRNSENKKETEKEEHRKEYLELLQKTKIERKSLIRARKIKEWLEKRDIFKAPTVETQEMERKMRQSLNYIGNNLVKPYIELEREEEKEKYRQEHPALYEIMEIVGEIWQRRR